ncbi:hypothetical protein BU23DRAFT_552405 [Bimuria novae-zelandiae CBS 107.79]|uniref:Uncharacterized protein n=1 Tax=Bimuria novae-zelandiae CBS 107.79 TaxID=1447943 RepID=A0A6A5VG99_9PLEO|nr:hypothetical protein BU23DRAFT_552405 [Bimuria novae-zelandiae CBS 107.79]
MNGTNLPSLPTYVEKMIKYTRRAASTAEVGTLSTSVAELGIAKPCICGLSHALHDCYILNLNYLIYKTSLVINLMDKGQSSLTR